MRIFKCLFKDCYLKLLGLGAYVCVCECECVFVCVLVSQSCPAVCDSMDCSLPGSSIR